MHYVNYNNVKSELMTVKCAVPQGSVLDPLLFIIYINDLPNALKHCKCIMFADDSTLYTSFSSMTELSNDTNTDLAFLAEWFRANKLSLNINKSMYIIFTNRRIDLYPDINISTQEIEHVKSTKFLGLTIDDQISWREHIETCKTKLSSTLYILREVKNYVTHHCLKSLYDTMFYPYLTYGVLLWGFACQTHMKKKLKSCKKVRIVVKEAYSHTDSLFSRFNILKLVDIYKLN